MKSHVKMAFSRRNLIFRSASAAFALTVTCAASPVGNSAAAQGMGELLPLTLSHIPIMPYSNAIIAAGKGFFKEAGLDVTRKVIPGSDIIRSALTAGEIDIAAMSIDSLARGHLAGFDWKILYPGVMYDPAAPDAFLVARSDVTVNSAKDLENKTIGVTLGTIAEVGVKAWLREKGADPGKVRFVEVRFPQMLGALESKSIDAAHIVEPFLTMGLEKGTLKIVAPDLDPIGGRFVVAMYIAKGSWIAANPEKAKRFTEAMAKATKFVIDKPAEALPVIAADTRLDPALAAKFFPKRYVAATEMKPEELQRVIDFLAREKYIDKGFSYREIVSAYAPVRP
jgi:NitT/TauT family transport system substrate-binding protein